MKLETQELDLARQNASYIHNRLVKRHGELEVVADADIHNPNTPILEINVELARQHVVAARQVMTFLETLHS